MGKDRWVLHSPRVLHRGSSWKVGMGRLMIIIIKTYASRGQVRVEQV